MTSFTEENYLKTIFHLSLNKSGVPVSTNELALATNTKAASVTDMIKRLSDKKYISYTKYQGVSLSDVGKRIALKIVRKHRLWEVFLVEKLGFDWDEIHDIAEELEHIDSFKLTDRLAQFLGNPKFDPHGDPIPDSEGNMPNQDSFSILKASKNEALILKNVTEDSPAFLQHLNKLNLKLGSVFEIHDQSDFDQSLSIKTNKNEQITLSHEISQHLFVVKG